MWRVEKGEGLDPVNVLEAYNRRRIDLFGPSKTMPMFIHENGNIYTKLELNSDLTRLLELFPELESPRDKWSGHSFRAGLATVLAVLGYSKEDIQSWGRWRSDSYLLYLKDQSHRRKVSSKLTNTFDLILAKVNK